jgi:hypothetical protein
VSPLLTAVLLLVSVAITAWIVLALVRRGRPAPKEARPTWLGADAVGVEADLRRELDQARWAEGHPSLRSDAGLDELARHHAHFLAQQRRDTARDDQGRDVTGRRLLLYPELLGAIGEARALTEASDTAAAVAALGPTLTLAWCDPQWTAGCVGVATRDGLVAACAVLARRAIVLESAPWIEDARHPGEPRVSDASVELSGVTAEAASGQPRFTLRPPHGDERDVRARTGHGGRIALTMTLDTEGVHELCADGDTIFIFRFGDHQQY